MTASGFLLYDKPAGRTSFSALGAFRKAYPGARIGHTGTLDSFATGLLVVMVGAYSRVARWFTGLDKVYRAEIVFGQGTDTLDPAGIFTVSGPVPERTALEAALPAFRGSILQTPPNFSAIHVQGRRASELAMEGIEAELAPRRLSIYRLEMLDYAGGVADFLIHCSSGTYVRALARDIAHACGTCAHVRSLRRMKVGPFDVADSAHDESALQELPLLKLDPSSASHLGLATGFIDAGIRKSFLNGDPKALESFAERGTVSKEMAIFDREGCFLGIIETLQGNPRYVVVMPGKEAA
jgi:tRNA pseudouridine55 synthase